MSIFVAGVLGRRVVPQLTAAGHDVVAVARSDRKAEQLRSVGRDRSSSTCSTSRRPPTTAVAGDHANRSGRRPVRRRAARPARRAARRGIDNVILLHTAGGRITHVHALRNPAKLGALVSGGGQ